MAAGGTGVENLTGQSRAAVTMARAIVVVFFVALATLALMFVIDYGHSAAEVALCIACLLALLALQLFYFSRRDISHRSPLTYLALAAQAVLVYLPMLLLADGSFTGMATLLAATVLLVLPAAVAWPAFVAIVVGNGWIWAAIYGSGAIVSQVMIVSQVTVEATVVALEVYGLTRLAQLVGELHEARGELARSAVAEERLRFARDLHDLLGLSLSAIAPKGELARRLVTTAADRARLELAEIAGIARRALADVRKVARDHRRPDLDEASRTAESVLAASAVDVRMELHHGELPISVRHLLAAVLRAGVTTVLHSRAERCEIILRQTGDTVSLDIGIDGIDPAAAEQATSDGIATLSTTVDAAGGTLTAGPDPHGRFRLQVTAPVSRTSTRADHPAPPEPAPRGATFPATALAAVVFCGMLILDASRLWTLGADAAQIAVRVATASVLVLLQLFYYARPNIRLDRPLSYLVLLVQAGIVYLPLALYDTGYLGLPGFLAGSVLLVLRPVAAWTAFAAILASVAAVQAAQHASVLAVWFTTSGALLSGLAVFGLTWMVRAVAELRAARTQLAQAAVADERVRFARDLHDLLGISLSAIALKSELADRLTTTHPTHAQHQITEILSITRHALTDVPTIAAGSHELSLDEELASAKSLLSAVDIDVRINHDPGELPPPVRTLLATVLREGVTNVLRHSHGNWCEISVSRQDHLVVLDIVNDGATHPPGAPQAGSGIHNLTARLATLGGRLHTHMEDGGRYRLQAHVPT